MAKPVVVVLREVGPLGDFCAHCGEVMATIFQKLGAVGVVSNCAVRDAEQVRKLGFHYFARGMVASHGNFRIVRVNVPVEVCGLRIATGDLLHGDINGLIKVPEHGRDKLPRLVDEVYQSEKRILDCARRRGFAAKDLHEYFAGQATEGSNRSYGPFDNTGCEQ